LRRTRVVPELVAALDLSESSQEALRELGTGKLGELANSIVPEWRQKPPRPRPARPVVPSGPRAAAKPRSSRTVIEELWDDRAEQLMALMFVAAEPLTRTQATELLYISASRLGRACRVMQLDPPRGLRLEEAGEQLQLAIVAYEQPITRSGISGIRGTDSSAIVETVMARKLVAEDPRFGGRGRPSFLVTTAAFLEYFGLTSLSELPPRPTPEPVTISRPQPPLTTTARSSER
jgi:segregation and condensation protein B